MPLIWATKNSYGKVFSVLLQYAQINPNIKDKLGDTVLVWATCCGNKKTVIALLGHAKIDPRIKNRFGDTALMWAAKQGYEEIVSIIQDHLRIRSIATINQSIHGLHEAIHGRNPVMFFNQPVPKEINIEIAALTGDPSVYTQAQANKIAATGYCHISP